MEPIDPALFYTGVAAQAYGLLRGTGAPDPLPYARFIERSGQPALELGCGDGDPLLALRTLGLDVDGVDSSPDMVDRLHAAAADREIDVSVQVQRMEALDLPRRYRSVFLAGPTFNLLPDDDTARQALAGIRRHLVADGTAMIPLFEPRATPVEHFGRRRTRIASDGTEMSVTAVSQTRDEPTRCQTTVLRYEVVTPTGTVSEDRPWTVHWYAQAGIRAMAADAGLTVARVLSAAGGAADDGETDIVLLLRRDDADTSSR
jgi:SAM-dependent methyltransferase